MYLDFYLLKKAPFHITPDPEFLFLSPSHKAALGALVYGIEERQGFVALLGEVFKGEVFCKPLIIYRFSLPASAALSPRFLMQPSAWP